MRLSKRTAWDREEDGFAAALAAANRSGNLLDLTVANPTRCGFSYDAAALLAPLADARALRYMPAPFGLHEARDAVARYYGDHGATVRPETICLTTSTSEAYGFLFQLLCDPGDEVLIARPSYPLFELLARLHDVRLREYPLHEEPGVAVVSATGEEGNIQSAFCIDLHLLRMQINNRTRAIVVVHPNNPTGNFVPEVERRALEELCAEHGLALIVDEVFLDYSLPSVQARTFAGGTGSALCFVLSGVSKVCALPQMKASWIVTSGPETLLHEALERLEIIADTYLSLNAPVQLALPLWLEGRADIQEQIRRRLRANLETLDRRLRGSAGSRLPLQGGWTAVIRIPRHVDDVEFALACLERSVVVQPGELYGLPASRAVLSLLTPPEHWAEGLARLPI